MENYPVSNKNCWLFVYFFWNSIYHLIICIRYRYLYTLSTFGLSSFNQLSVFLQNCPTLLLVAQHSEGPFPTHCLSLCWLPMTTTTAATTTTRSNESSFAVCTFHRVSLRFMREWKYKTNIFFMPCINYECLFNAFTIKGQQQPQLIFIQIFDSIFLFIFVYFLFFLLLWLKLFLFWTRHDVFCTT